MVHEAIERGDRVIVEGAQGTLLDIDLGTYPFVTSSNSSACGISAGIGIPPGLVDRSLGVLKAYSTRVGEGPFPTELAGEEGEALRRQGGEFGATTGRPRRCGWFDAVAARFALRVNGVREVALTKLDVLRGFDPIRIATSYEIEGRRVEDLPTNLAAIDDVRPVYEELPGFDDDLSAARLPDDLPRNARRYVEALETMLGVDFFLISVGSERDETIATAGS
jgi:adenylosuccinate synthase